MEETGKSTKLFIIEGNDQLNQMYQLMVINQNNVFSAMAMGMAKAALADFERMCILDIEKTKNCDRKAAREMWNKTQWSKNITLLLTRINQLRDESRQSHSDNPNGGLSDAFKESESGGGRAEKPEDPPTNVS